MIQFVCLCGQAFYDQSPSISIRCPTCNISIQTPKKSFFGLNTLCIYCATLTPYTPDWLKKIRCGSCKKKFKAPPIDTLFQKLQEGEKKRLATLEQTSQTTLQHQQEDFLQQLKTGEDHCQTLMAERDHYFQQFQYTFEEKTTLEQALYEKQQELSQTQEFATHLQTELESSRNTIQDDQNELSETKQQVTRIQHAFQEAQKEFTLTEKHWTQAQQKLIQTQQELTQTQQELTQTQQELAQTQQEITQTQQELSTTQKSNLQRLEEERSHLERVSGELEKTQHDLKVSEFACKEEKLKSQQLSTDLSKTQQDETHWKTKFQETTLQHKNLSEKHQQLQNVYQQLQQRYQDFTIQNDQLLQQKSDLLQKQTDLLQTVEALSQTQQTSQNTETHWTETIRSISKEWDQLLHHCERFFSQRLKWLEPRWNHLPLDLSKSLREVENDSPSIVKAALEGYHHYDRTLLKNYLRQIETALHSDIQFKYHRAIETRKKLLKEIPKEIHDLRAKLERLNLTQGEMIAQIKQTTQETLNVLATASPKFFEQIAPNLKQAPSQKIIATSNLQLHYFCQRAQERHQTLLTDLVQWHFHTLCLRLPWIRPFRFQFHSPTLPEVFQSPMKPTCWKSLPLHLSSFFPILFARLFPIHRRLPLWGHQTLLRQQGKKILQPLFFQQRIHVEAVLKEFLKTEMKQLQFEFDLQIEKQKRKLHQLINEQHLIEFQEKQLMQRRDHLEIMQKGVQLLLQDLDDLPEVEDLDRFYTSFHQFQKTLREAVMIPC